MSNPTTGVKYMSGSGAGTAGHATRQSHKQAKVQNMKT